MEKTEQIKKLKGLINKIERASGELRCLGIDTMEVLDEIDNKKVRSSHINVLEQLNKVKFILEEKLKYLQESNENILNN